MKEKLQRFMYGRYGADKLNRFIMILSLLIWVVSMFTTELLYFVSVAGIILVYFRMFSKNIYKRAAENRVYLTYENKVLYFFRKKKSEFQQLKTHHIYKCPTCRQKIRIPRGKGRIEITCPKCRHAFIKKS
jgi:DNA-directed RNA polymerase subunit RPC12/RpoP